MSTNAYPASIGPCGIEMFQGDSYLIPVTELQSDRVELKFYPRA